jgi:hypothetical protein
MLLNQNGQLGRVAKPGVENKYVIYETEWAFLISAVPNPVAVRRIGERQ